MSDMQKLVFQKRDFLYDNGLVNLYLLYQNLLKKGLDCKSKIILNESSIIIEGTENEKLLDSILFSYLESIFSFHPKNRRLYWDRNTNCIIEAPTLNVKGATKQEMKHKYIYENITTLTTGEGNVLTLQYLKDQIVSNFPQYQKDIDADSIKQLIDKKGSVSILCTLKEYIEKEIGKRKQQISNAKSTIICTVCNQNLATTKFSSLTHPFDDGSSLFSDYLSVSGQAICEKCNLIYQLGSRKAHYYSEESQEMQHYFYLHSYSLLNLYEIKNALQINEDKIEVYDEKKNTNKTKANNFHFFSSTNSISKYSISSNGNNDKLLKLLVGIFKELTTKEKSWTNIEDTNVFEGSSIVYFSDTKSGKSSLSSYDKLSDMFKLFVDFCERFVAIPGNETISIFDLFFRRNDKSVSIINKIAEGGATHLDDYDRPYFQDFVNTFLTFKPLHSYYYKFQFYLLKHMEKKGTLPESLKEFEEAYITFTQGKDSPDLLIHELCYRVGREIGRFLGFLGEKNKDLIFVLRAVNNQEQLIAFLRDFQFKYLKDKETQVNNQTFKFSTSEDKNIDFFNSFESLLEIVAHNRNITMIRDYLALYIISSFSRQIYFSKKS